MSARQCECPVCTETIGEDSECSYLCRQCDDHGCTRERSFTGQARKERDYERTTAD